jgi:hypothetical protein
MEIAYKDANARWQQKRKLLGQLLVVRCPVRNLGPAGINQGCKLPQIMLGMFELFLFVPTLFVH